MRKVSEILNEIERKFVSIFRRQTSSDSSSEIGRMEVRARNRMNMTGGWSGVWEREREKEIHVGLGDGKRKRSYYRWIQTILYTRQTHTMQHVWIDVNDVNGGGDDDVDDDDDVMLIWMEISTSGRLSGSGGSRHKLNNVWGLVSSVCLRSCRWSSDWDNWMEYAGDNSISPNGSHHRLSHETQRDENTNYPMIAMVHSWELIQFTNWFETLMFRMQRVAKENRWSNKLMKTMTTIKHSLTDKIEVIDPKSVQAACTRMSLNQMRVNILYLFLACCGVNKQHVLGDDQDAHITAHSHILFTLNSDA